MNFKKNMLIATYILDTYGNVIPKICSRSIPEIEHRWDQFATILPPLKTKLPVTTEGKDVGILFYLFSAYRSFENTHIYAKSIIYSYLQLLKQSNILDTGRVYFVVDEFSYPTVLPYFEATGLSEMILINSNNLFFYKNHTGFIPFLDHDKLKECRYVFQMDADLFLINYTPKKFDWHAFANKIEAYPEHLYGRTYKDDPQVLYEKFTNNLYQPARIKDIDTAKTLINKLFNTHRIPYPIRFMGGDFIGLKTGTQTALRLQEFYKEINNVFLDDQVFITLFLKKFEDINYLDIRKENIIKMGHTFSEMLDNHPIFFHLPKGINKENYADYEKLYNHIMEGL